MSNDVPLRECGILSHFQPFQPVFSWKWLVLAVISNSVMFNISNCNRNVAVLFRLRGLTMFGVMPLSRYGIFNGPRPLKSLPLKIFKRKLTFFWFLVVKEPYTGQITIETWVIPTKWGVHHISTTNGYRDMEFWHFWRPRATPVHNTPGQTVDFFRNNLKMFFNLISYVPSPKKVIQTLIWSKWYSNIHPIYTPNNK